MYTQALDNPKITPLSPPLPRGEMELDPLPLARGGLGWGISGF